MVFVKCLLRGITTMIGVTVLLFLTMLVLLMANHPSRPIATDVTRVVRAVPFIMGWIPFRVTAAIAFVVGFSWQFSNSRRRNRADSSVAPLPPDAEQPT